MPLTTATVEFVPLRNALCNLPGSLASMLFVANIPAQLAVVELNSAEPRRGGRSGDGSSGRSRETETSGYCGWTGLSSARPDTIELDPTFAANLRIDHGQKVRLSVSAQAPVAHSILLEPVSFADWQIVETHATFLEVSMINQVRAVSLGKHVTVFPSSTQMAALLVKRIDPPPDGNVARLSPECEVIIAPKSADKSEDATNIDVAHQQQSKQVLTPITTVQRATVHPYLPNLDTNRLEIRGNLSLFCSGHKVEVSLATPSILKPPPSPSGENDASEVPRAVKIIATFVQDPKLPLLGLSFGLECALSLRSKASGDGVVGAKVFLKSIPNQNFPTISNAKVRPYSLSSGPQITLAKREHYSTEQLQLDVIYRGLVLPPQPLLPFGGIVDVDPSQVGVTRRLTVSSEVPLPESQSMGVVEIQAKDDTLVENDASVFVVPRQIHPKRAKRPLIGRDVSVSNLYEAVLGANGVLLYGSRGCGKSVLLQNLSDILKENHIRPIFFKSSNYVDKALPTIRDAWKKVSYEAAWYAPSVVIFDDIDKMIPAQQDDYNGDSSRQQQAAESFVSIWEPLILSGKVSVLASAQGTTQVHGYLLSSHLLDTTIHLKSPDRELKESILRSALVHTPGFVVPDSLDLIDIISDTEGYQPGDMWILVERLASILSLKEESTVSSEAVKEAASDYTPASLRGVKLETPDTKWDDIGGLFEAKRLVLETMDWPTKYGPIFATCPLRLRSGLLFYGYPGCGKTMLASSIARKTGLNFISVKGPEILNKYIGASEQSVRDLFERAQAAKPCVLFFDEFDSIAPKRGHDATGVTDRVVNQLLTQMDGAEGLDGVYVLAATSRPDLIDSALLRPGRLDKSLLCDMPDLSARLDIIERAASKLALDNDVDLQFVAERTEGYSGADLQALIYSAYLKRVHASLEIGSDAATIDQSTATKETCRGFQVGPGDVESAKPYMTGSGNADDSTASKTAIDRVPVGDKELKEALLDSKPSISRKEAGRFKAIYSEFSADRNGEMPPGTSSNEIGARVTLQ